MDLGILVDAAVSRRLTPILPVCTCGLLMRDFRSVTLTLPFYVSGGYGSTCCGTLADLVGFIVGFGSAY